MMYEERSFFFLFSFFLLHVDTLLFKHHLLRRSFFLLWIAFAPLWNISCPCMCGSISGLPMLFHSSICLYTNTPLDICSFIINIESGVNSLIFFFFFKVVYSMLLAFPYEFSPSLLLLMLVTGFHSAFYVRKSPSVSSMLKVFFKSEVMLNFVKYFFCIY